MNEARMKRSHDVEASFTFRQIGSASSVLMDISDMEKPAMNGAEQLLHAVHDLIAAA